MVIQVKLVKLGEQHPNNQHWFGLSFWDKSRCKVNCALWFFNIWKNCHVTERFFLIYDEWQNSQWTRITFDELQNFKMTIVASKNGHLWRIQKDADLTSGIHFLWFLWLSIHLLVLNIGNGWEWGLLGWLLLVIMDHSRKFPAKHQ